jgi:NAD(P)-dependent dehydrogenase (short-subunit alcohol dehydrogenase family)
VDLLSRVGPTLDKIRGLTSTRGRAVDRLAGKAAIVTGAGSGIGRATACRFAAEGARVVVAEINDESGSKTESLISSESGGQACFIHTDVSDPQRVERMVNTSTGLAGLTSFTTMLWHEASRTDPSPRLGSTTGGGR